MVLCPFTDWRTLPQSVYVTTLAQDGHRSGLLAVFAFQHAYGDAVTAPLASAAVLDIFKG
jgi:hypothetical protein